MLKFKSYNSNREIIEHPILYFSSQVKNYNPNHKLYIGIPKDIKKGMNIQRDNEHEFRVIILRKNILKKPKAL